jgi:predicted RNase H-like nuclease (RuvC/YqgF family)
VNAQTERGSGWTDEQHDAYDLGAQTEREHQEALARLVIRKHQEQIDDLTQRLAAVSAERDELRQELAECAEVAGALAQERDHWRRQHASGGEGGGDGASK